VSAGRSPALGTIFQVNIDWLLRWLALLSTSSVANYLRMTFDIDVPQSNMIAF
jgi:hypothetical protein